MLNCFSIYIYKEQDALTIVRITYVLEQLEGSEGYIAYCPVMRPVRVFGKTREEATKKIPDAIKLYLEKHPELETRLESIDTDVN